MVSTPKRKLESKHALSSAALRCRRKFLRFFPNGFFDETYLDWERNYKWEAHVAWHKQLDQETHHDLLMKHAFVEVAARAVRIEARTNLLFSFEKMALRDAVKTKPGARLFAQGLYEFLYGSDELGVRFTRWCEVVNSLPRKQTRVLTWPLVTVFGFVAQPETHFFLKPNVTRRGAREYEYDLKYASRPSWDIYAGMLDFARTVKKDIRDLRPRDMIDVQSFIWVQGSDEYEE